ncbi:3-ketoacyl-(acyl-carrier-protein) reductase [Mycobacterium shottsii]|uniref:SDR family NAD(P)-dependent oxidoreductase n=1 Tax=Mycobacterium shottsii TaxID=133549 RepID=A0A7I7LG52_9MYCO|nr:3-ketoacyl-(acyl-carrier-protein) reductase [Mycobacterium shottsii]BBX58590.1 hypothetical protein MSHO_39350 [Mycobacterium shottsii]
MSDRDLLAGRGVVVVGGSRGIGRAVAELLARRGAGVVISGREPDAVHDATEAVISAGGSATGIAGAADHEDTENAQDRHVVLTKRGAQCGAHRYEINSKCLVRERSCTLPSVCAYKHIRGGRCESL